MKVLAVCLTITAGTLMAASIAWPVEYAADRSKDPFRKKTMQASAVGLTAAIASPAPRNTDPGRSGYVLEGALWNSAQPMAIINGQIAKVGAKIGNAEVLEISKEGVRMKEFDREFTLTKETRISR